MICLTGEKGLFDERLAHLKKLYSDGKLNDWQIIAAEVPLFITYTPYRNVYKSIADMAHDLGDVKDKIAAVETQIAAVNTKFETLIAKIETKIETTVAEAVNKIMGALNANRPQQSDTGADGRRRNRVVNGLQRIPKMDRFVVEEKKRVSLVATAIILLRQLFASELLLAPSIDSSDAEFFTI